MPGFPQKWGQEIHIPDNYLNPETCLMFGAVMVPVLAVSVRRVRKKCRKRV
ncbi:energy-coupling factor ABC transporter permease [Sporolactobacillus sp. KGMB 08714]|uniref:energy-coupling factor ABC transporter permease n=1 Tax=Sporolactobacillus sp. KGMB 08714 TaxID=3064704 RepID=UPI002FBE18AA